MVFTVLLRLCVVLCIISQINGFADWMTKDFCRRSMAVGEVLMNAEVTASDERTVLVFRGEQELHSGDVYIPGEVLEIRVSDSKPQYVLEVIGPASAQFTAGGCDGTRIANKPRAELNLPIAISSKDNNDAKHQEEESQEEMEDDGDGSVKIHVAWATGHSTVYLSPDFILLPKTSEIAASVTTSTSTSNNEKVDSEVEAKKDTESKPSPDVDTHRRDTPATNKAVSPAKSPAYVPSTVTTKNQAPLNASLAAWQQSLSQFASSSLNTTLHSLKHTFPLHHLNHTTANDLVSRTGKLFSDLEKAALEELASSSGRVSQSLGGVADTHDRVALQMQAREKRQQLEKEKRLQQQQKRKSNEAVQLRGSDTHKTRLAPRHTHSETQLADQSSSVSQDTAQDTESSADATRDTVETHRDTVSLEQRKRDKVRVLQQQRHTQSHDTTPPRTSLHFQESETAVDPEGDDTEEDTVAAVSRRHKNVHSSRHPVLRMLIRVVLVFGVLFLATLCCGSAMLVWHGRHAVWRALRRKLGFHVTGDDKQQN